MKNQFGKVEKSRGDEGAEMVEVVGEAQVEQDLFATG